VLYLGFAQVKHLFKTAKSAFLGFAQVKHLFKTAKSAFLGFAQVKHLFKTAGTLTTTILKKIVFLLSQAVNMGLNSLSPIPYSLSPN
jgi:hypothetical protein